MAYRQVYFRIRTDCYSSGWTSDADRAAFKEESRRLFQELGWTVKLALPPASQRRKTTWTAPTR